MSETRKIVKFFLASPGDLSEERRMAKIVVDEFNKLWSETLSYQVELVGWEDTVSAFGRPQSVINLDLQRCEYFIGMLWKRWGTPPDLEGKFTSGFEEEFSISLENRKTVGRPHMSLFFKSVGGDLLQDPGEELKKVISFKENIIRGKEIIYEEFSDLGDFETKFRRCVSHYVQTLFVQDKEASKNEGQTSSSIVDPSTIDRENSDVFNHESDFVISVGRKIDRDQESDQLSPVDISRFRLISTTLRSPANDLISLGLHDANILYKNKETIVFSNSEKNGLLRCGLDHFDFQHAPLWYWVSALGFFDRHLLSIYSMEGVPAERRVGALKAMRLIREPLSPELQRSAYYEDWFGDETPIEVKRVALEYLGDAGIEDDVSIISRQIEEGDSRLSEAATEAVLRVKIRSSAEAAVSYLPLLQIDHIRSRIIDEIFSDPSLVQSVTLRKVLSHRNGRVRYFALKILGRRNEITTEVFESFLADSYAAVRFEAFTQLVDRGRSYTLPEAKEIIVKPSSHGIAGLLGPSDSEGEAFFETYRESHFRSLPDEELRRFVSGEDLISRSAYYVLVERYAGSMAIELRRGLDSKFKTEYTEYVQGWARRLGNDHSMVSRAKELENYVTEKLTVDSLSLICLLGSEEDVGRVRRLIKDGYIDRDLKCIDYLGKFGDWSDVPLILSSIAGKRIGFGVYNDWDNIYDRVSRVLMVLGQSRFLDLIRLEAPSGLRRKIAIRCPVEEFTALSDADIDKLLRDQDSDVRKTLAQKCVVSLELERVKLLLSVYMNEDEPYYYDVVHWLDFGVSLPLERARSVVTNIFAAPSHIILD